MSLKAILSAVLFAPTLALAALPAGTMYKDPYCGCCGEHAKYLRNAGFDIKEVVRQDMQSVKQQYGTDIAQSCHTIVMQGYAIEGHVPANAIRKLLKEKPNAKGITVSGMPATSPGMGDYKVGTIAVEIIGKDGSLKPYGKF
ncbi:DUF411 domain-containing protein [Deefgea piscis]|uniref:CopG family transcriptional regulator n=1 Tax=Deefgea piscis TaxID=2739061 RepID=A0A6M8SUM0_9NEIS|nr:DUF411 domain-containing protein [Deefgea piscis]QKJ67236.1 CopG family transcriptional regulator [Deefgea piscis]QZA82479.1 CopG family transcriptional regulator [Deefgea piscis]